MAATLRSIFKHGTSLVKRETLRLWSRSKDVILINWHLGFTAFGGPTVHYQIFHERFVEKHKWIDEQFYQEIFAISQALPGPGSTKMLFCINYSYGGLLAAVGAFLIWSLPGAVGMYGLSLGVAHVGETLPPPVYALLSGLNAATVGIIIFAGVQLARKAIVDQFTRVLVFLGAAFGMLYTALWYFPVLLLAAGLTTVAWDFKWLHRIVQPLRRKQTTDLSTEPDSTESETRHNAMEMRDNPTSIRHISDDDLERSMPPPHVDASEVDNLNLESETNSVLSWKTGILIIILFMVSFVTFMIIRGLLTSPPRGYSIFANIYLAGTIIFGGGPVVIPLLREYMVAERWVSPRDFLFGLALIQAFPGPNFNFAVYLGSLATSGTSLASFGGALVAYVGIFAPGIIIQTGVMGVWKVLRSRRWFTSLLRGVNAAAVGFVYTAVYRLWQIGFVDANHQTGSSLGRDPWWVIITATTFVGGAWFRLSAVMAVVLGAVMGLLWYAVVNA